MREIQFTNFRCVGSIDPPKITDEQRNQIKQATKDYSLALKKGKKYLKKSRDKIGVVPRPGEPGSEKYFHEI